MLPLLRCSWLSPPNTNWTPSDSSDVSGLIQDPGMLAFVVDVVQPCLVPATSTPFASLNVQTLGPCGTTGDPELGISELWKSK